VRVRRATAGDAEAIAAVHVAAWRAAYRGQVPQEHLDGLDAAARAASWQRAIAAADWPRAGVLVLVDDRGTVIGFAHVCPSRDGDTEGQAGELSAIYLAPQTWRQGGGSMLMHAAVECMREAGVSSVTLWVLDGNRPARMFYEAFGFRADGISAGLTIGGAALTEVRYSLSLRRSASR
jgi:GNAT superfamily N-acetyltransferase